MADSLREEFERLTSALGDQCPPLVLLRAYASPPGGFSESFRRRVIDVNRSSARWIAEAVGLTCVGKIVVLAALRSDFTGRFWNDLRHVAAPARANLTLMAIPPAGESDEAGRSDDLALLRLIASAELFAPCDAEEMGHALRHGVTRHALTYIRCPGNAWDEPSTPIFNGTCQFSPGVWPTLCEGDGLTLITCGNLTEDALVAARKLASEGIQAAVVHAGSIQPADRRAIVESARKTKILITCEEHAAPGGLGGVVADAAAEAGISVRLLRLCLPGARRRTAPATESMVRAALAFGRLRRRGNLPNR